MLTLTISDPLNMSELEVRAINYFLTYCSKGGEGWEQQLEESSTSSLQPEQLEQLEKSSTSSLLNLSPQPKQLDESQQNEKLSLKTLPWDARIHSSSKSKNKDGSYRLKREIDPETVQSVISELTSTMNAQAPVDTDLSSVFGGNTPVYEQEIISQSQIIPPPPSLITSVVPSLQNELANPPALSFAKFMAKITESVMNGKLQQQQCLDALAKCGLPSLAMVSQREDLIPFLMGELCLI